MERMLRLNISRYKLFATVFASIGLLLLSFIFIITKDDSIARKRQNELTSLNGRSFWMLWASELFLKISYGTDRENASQTRLATFSEPSEPTDVWGSRQYQTGVNGEFDQDNLRISFAGSRSSCSNASPSEINKILMQRLPPQRI